jgi:hypothetical protein
LRVGFIAATMIALYGFPGRSEPARIINTVNLDGDCRRFEIAKLAKEAVEGTCRSDVQSLGFEDGFTSVQFHATGQNGTDTETVAFVGPRWTEVDATRNAMVIDQVVLSQPHLKSLNPITASGFCLFERKNEADPPYKCVRVHCEYSTRNGARIFTLENISNSDFRGVK